MRLGGRSRTETLESALWTEKAQRPGCQRDMIPLRRMKSSGLRPPGCLGLQAAAERERQKVEGRWDVGAEPGMSALWLTDGTQQEWERPALALPGVPGNVIKHPADPLVMGIWIPPGPPAHPDPQLAVLTGSRQEKRPALLARPVSMSSSATNPALIGLPQAGAGGRGSGWELMEPGRPCQWPWLGHPNRKPGRWT